MVKKMCQRLMLWPLNRKKLVGDDAENGGASSAKPVAPNLTSSNASE
jgi:hypothetical protein